MAKLTRKKHHIQIEKTQINLETGDVTQETTTPWSLSKQNYFVKCVSLVEQIKEQQLNIVDETNITAISYCMVVFGDKGRSLFEQVNLFQSVYNSEQLATLWNTALDKSAFKTPQKFISICKDKGLLVKLNEDEGWEYRMKIPGQGIKYVTDELTEQDVDDIREYGFITKDNCYFFADFDAEHKVCLLTKKSNFMLHILFHINRGKQNKRVIEMVNVYNRKVTCDIETKQLTSFQLFKELTEGHGNFLFEGTNIELQKIKNKLFTEERPSLQIDMLGWNRQGKFFAFSNGLYNSTFHPVDEHGIVTLHEKNYFIPYHPGTDEYSHLNEKKFSFKPSLVTFEEWSTLYCRAFGKPGEVALIFGIATLFSDHIFAVRGNFPMLFLYGEGGSGKSRVGLYLQQLWGDPQPPLKLSEKANTDKSKIRKMAQYVNAMALFEEFINELDMSVIKTITGIYDRFGYERSNMDSKYGTETVPINSSAMITGNSYPNDDPLMQRVIMFDYNTNIRDKKVTEAYDKLTDLNRQGITTVTGQLLQLRAAFVQHWEQCFRPQFDAFKQIVSKKGITVPDRMIENYAVILTTAKVLKYIGLKLPFDLEDLSRFMADTIVAQAEKRDTGSVIQRFWDIVLQLANEGTIRHCREYTITGAIVAIRFTEIHGMYMEKHARIYRAPGLGKSTLLQKLKDSGMMAKSEATSRRMGSTNVVSCHEFLYDKLGIDLLSPTLYWEAERSKHRTKSGENAAVANQSQGGEYDTNSGDGGLHPLQVATNPGVSATNDPQQVKLSDNETKPPEQAGNEDLPF